MDEFDTEICLPEYMSDYFYEEDIIEEKTKLNTLVDTMPNDNCVSDLHYSYEHYNA